MTKNTQDDNIYHITFSKELQHDRPIRDNNCGFDKRGSSNGNADERRRFKQS